MQQLVDVASPPITFLLLLAVGLDLTPGDFRRLRERPGMVAAGVLLRRRPGPDPRRECAPCLDAAR